MYGVWVGFFLYFSLGLLVVPSCGSLIGFFSVAAYGSFGGSIIGIFIWVFGEVRVEVYVVMVWALGGVA